MRVKLMLFFLVLGSCLFSEARAHCSLDKMKTFAMEACERLFQNDEPRERRSIGFGHHKNKLSHDKMDKKTPHGIKRSSFPDGGYLKVSSEHYHRLMQLNVRPPYKPLKPLKQHQDKRHKRESSGNNYISYCCYNHCNYEFFC